MYLWYLLHDSLMFVCFCNIIFVRQICVQEKTTKKLLFVHELCMELCKCSSSKEKYACVAKKSYVSLWCFHRMKKRLQRIREMALLMLDEESKDYGKHASLLVLAWLLWFMWITKECSTCMWERCKEGYKMLVIKRTPIGWCDHKGCKNSLALYQKCYRWLCWFLRWCEVQDDGSH